MNELNRTAIFVVIAVILSAITYFTMPSTEQQSPADMVGKSLLPDFDDPLEATSLEVVKFDKETASEDTFKVAKIGDSWVIPSHNNYPADAEDQLADVAAEWIDLEVLGVATDPEESGIESDDIRGLHKLYGVVDPVGEDTGDAEAVGTRVVMRDKSDSELVGLIVGKEVEDQFGLRYVRRIGQDPVYTVKASTSKLSTKFEDWIEDDLLKLSSWDISSVDIDDYSVDILQGFITPRGQISLEYNDTGDPRWNLAVDRVYAKEGWTDKGMAENEELNTETLNDLKSALDDLKIVDVRRKPNGLSETLKSTGAIKLDREAEQSLSQAGFHVVPVADPNNPGQQYNDLRSNEGQISVGMKDGVSYILRFGQIAGMSADEEEPEKKDAEGDETEAAEEQEEESSGSKVNRYLFVMVQLDRSMIEEPEYEALPELPPAEEAKPEAPKADDDKEEKADDAKEAKPEEAKPEKAEGEEAKEDKPEEPEADSAKEEDGKPEGEEAEKKEEEPKPTREEIEKQREEIQKENDRKTEEYEEKIKEGEDKVKELNARFADWYYIINDGEYQKIHLSRDKIVKEKEEEEESDDASAAAPTGPAIAPNSMGEFEGLKLEPPAKK